VAIPSSIILARELAVSALREWMAQIGARDTVKVGWQGKCKTALTMVALTVLLLCPPVVASQSILVRTALPIGLVLLYAATVLTISSGWVYFKAAAPYLLEEK
jgi:phosphatidylglycerophosphate synthase